MKTFPTLLFTGVFSVFAFAQASADLVLLNGEIRAVVVMTIFDGKVIYERK
ncbi:MAG: hypothetical protein ABIU20_01870 [Blastocatellia bacterium]